MDLSRQCGVRRFEAQRWAGLVLVGMVVLALGSCHGADTYVGETASITIGSPAPTAWQLEIAQAEGLFTANGLEVAVERYPCGAEALKALVAGEVDLAFSTEYSVVRAILAGHDVQIIGTIDETYTTYLIARQDRGVKEVTHLVGQRIGVTRGGVAEFYLNRFLDLHDMQIDDVILVDVAPSQTADALVAGEVDAVIARQPAVTEIESRLRGSITTWHAQSHQASYGVVTVRSDWAEAHPDLVVRFLEAVDQALDTMERRPERAKAIIAPHLGVDAADVDRRWADHDFTLSLNQSLIVAMKGEARWMMARGLVETQEIPDLLEHVYADGLDAVRPEAVDLIR